MESFSITFVSALLYFILQLTASECELVFVFWFGGGGEVRFTFIQQAIPNAPVSVYVVLKLCMLSSEHLQISFLTYWCS